MRSNAHFRLLRLLRLLRLQPRRPARKCAGRGSAPPRSCAADSAQHAYRAIDRLADAWGSWPRRRVFFEGGNDTEPSNASQTPLPQRINGLSPLPCVLTCVLKPQSHCSYPQANMAAEVGKRHAGQCSEMIALAGYAPRSGVPTEFISRGCKAAVSEDGPQIPPKIPTRYRA